MKNSSHNILYSARAILLDKNSSQGITHDTAEAVADLIASVMEAEDEFERTATVSREELRNASAAPIPAAAPPSTPYPAPEPPKTEPSKNEKLIRQIQTIVDEAHTDNAIVILEHVKNAGIRLGTVADLLGAKDQAVYSLMRNKNKALEYKFWTVFSKPNITPREEE
ncbi:MAG: hypothetical protein BWY31_04360 [Lentisphaerae bacterium ADurb.Bin242]|nr:MAG: hypothetical protein BWY31_04360 [Lentisphaerae bacterium ADurb.Bin242]